MIVALTSTYDGAITLGVILTLTLSVIALVRWRYRHWSIGHSFSMHFPAGTYENPGKFHKSKELLSGQHDVLVRVKVKASLDIRHVNFRIFRKRGAKASIDDIEVLNIWERELESESKVRGPYTPRSSRFTSVPDDDGGYDGLYNPPFHKSANSYLWYRVIVGAYKPNKSYLSFQSEGADGQRQNVRLKLEVIDSIQPTFDTQHAQ